MLTVTDGICSNTSSASPPFVLPKTSALYTFLSILFSWKDFSDSILTSSISTAFTDKKIMPKSEYESIFWLDKTYVS